MMPSSHLILCRPLLLLPPIPPSITVFSNESTLLIRWPKYWNFSFSIVPSKEILGLISFRMDWLDLLAVQGTLKSLLQHHSSKASIQSPPEGALLGHVNQAHTLQTGRETSPDPWPQAIPRCPCEHSRYESRSGCDCACTPACTHTRTHVHAHVHTRTCAHTCTYTRAHTHTSPARGCRCQQGRPGGSHRPQEGTADAVSPGSGYTRPT